MLENQRKLTIICSTCLSENQRVSVRSVETSEIFWKQLGSRTSELQTSGAW